MAASHGTLEIMLWTSSESSQISGLPTRNALWMPPMLIRSRYRLLPYIIEQARSGAKLGVPVVRALVLEYPTDRNVWNIDNEYLFGSDILVAPTLQPVEDAGKQAVYIPAGTWFCFWDKKKFVSRGEWVEMDAAPIDSMHLWMKSGAMLCWTKERMRTLNAVGTVEKVELYGERHEGSGWTCGDGQGGEVEVVKEQDGKWACKGRNDVSVESFT